MFLKKLFSIAFSIALVLFVFVLFLQISSISTQAQDQDFHGQATDNVLMADTLSNSVNQQSGILRLEYSLQRVVLINEGNSPVDYNSLQFGGDIAGSFEATQWTLNFGSDLAPGDCVQLVTDLSAFEQPNCNMMGWIRYLEAEHFWSAFSGNASFTVFHADELITTCDVVIDDELTCEVLLNTVSTFPVEDTDSVIVTFGENITLHALDVDTQFLDTDNILTVNLIWSTDSALEEEYSVSVRLINQETGQLVAQHDSAPAEGNLPTTTWQTTAQIEDKHDLVLPENFAGNSNEYAIDIVVYEYQTGERLIVNDTDLSFSETLVVSAGTGSINTAGLSPIELAQQSVTSNNEWEPYIETFDGIEMVLVPSGCFMMGVADEQVETIIEVMSQYFGDPAGLIEDEQPVHQICFDEPFWIDRTEVTNQQFVDLNGNAVNEGLPDSEHPRTNIHWSEANEFCALRNAQLPTEAQWEYTARGPDNLIFPWGNDFVRENLGYWEGGGSGPLEDIEHVGSRSGNISWVGALELTTNAFEWTRSVYITYPYISPDGQEVNDVLNDRIVVRGGSGGNDPYPYPAGRGSRSGNWSGGYLGFRCVRSFSDDSSSVNSGVQSQDVSVLDGAITFNLPAEWTIDNSGASLGVIVLSNEDSNTDSRSLGVISYRSGHSSNLSTIQLLSQELGSLGLAEAPVISEVTINGEEAARYAGPIKLDNGINSETVAVIIRFEDSLLFVQLSSIGGADNIATFDAIVESINIDFATIAIDSNVLTPIVSNADWTPVIQIFDGVKMAFVPAGCFVMGSTDGQIDYAVRLAGRNLNLDDEQPPHEICFGEPFWIDVYEVTNEQYGSTGCTNTSANPTQPRNCVSWFDASAFCTDRGAKLPTETEWEYAARGPDSLIFPWGNEFIEDNVAYGGNYGDRTAVIGSHPQGVSWVGAMDMAGNLGEWTSSLYDFYPYLSTDGRENQNGWNWRSWRGSSYNYGSQTQRTSYRGSLRPDADSQLLGFRCARDFTVLSEASSNSETIIATEEATDGPIATEEPNDSPIATEEPNDSPIATEEPNDSPVVTEEPNDSPVVTEEPNDSPIATEELTDGSSTNGTRISINVTNREQTATAICRSAGYSGATEAERCNGSFFTFPETYSHQNCKEGVSLYQDCFDFTSCGHNSGSVEFRAVYCEN